ncbi:MAG TPA: hypothetical protein VIW69_01915, partial [Candidatus Elarobacter sp.]
MIRRLLLVAFVVLASVASPAAADQSRPKDSDPRLQRVEQWLNAVLHHQPGMDDAAAGQIGAWPNSDLRVLWVDASVLVQMMRSPRGLSFNVRQEGQSRPTPVRYTRDQFLRMRGLACAAAGTLTEPTCVHVAAPGDQHAGAAAATQVDADLGELARRAETSRRSGDHDNYILRRAALLHTDIAL